MALDLVDKGVVTDQLTLTVCYDTENLSGSYSGVIERDFYGRRAPKQAHGSVNLERFSSSSRLLRGKAVQLYEQITDPSLTIRRVYIGANHLISEEEARQQRPAEQLDFFSDPLSQAEEQAQEDAALEKEQALQRATLLLKKKFGKNSILKAMNLQESGTTIERNGQVGGHKA